MCIVHVSPVPEMDPQSLYIRVLDLNKDIGSVQTAFFLFETVSGIVLKVFECEVNVT